MFRSFASSLALFALLATNAVGAEFFVDNRIGSDGFDGRNPQPLSERSGPTRTIGRALARAGSGDTVIIANTGRPYFESLQLFGERHSGSFGSDFRIVGNGAVLSGLRLVPPSAWQHAGGDLWRMQTHRKGHVQLMLDGQRVPRHEGPPNALPVGAFCLHRGLVYFRGGTGERAPEMEFAFGYDDVGLTLYKVHDVTITGLQFYNYRLDGVAAPDSARRITLEGVTAVGNGRAGLSLDGVSTVVVRDGVLTGNAQHSVLLKGPAGLAVEGDSELDVDPTVE